MKLNRPVRHLLVDLDGTLLGNRNIPLSVDFLRKSYGFLRNRLGLSSAARLLYEMQAELSRPHPEHPIALRAMGVFARRLNLSIEESRLLVREGLFTIFPTLERHFFPIEGARDFLDWAKDRYSLTLATNPVWPQEIIELRVRWAGIDPALFQTITHARDMRACKPSLEYYEQVLSHKGFDAADCLLVGNDRKMDLPAVRAGIRVFIVGDAKGDFKETAELALDGAKAQAWKGSYAGLRALLESAAAG